MTKKRLTNEQMLKRALLNVVNRRECHCFWLCRPENGIAKDRHGHRAQCPLKIARATLYAVKGRP